MKRRILIHINKPDWFYFLVCLDSISLGIGRFYGQIGPCGLSLWWTVEKGDLEENGESYVPGTHKSVGWYFFPKKILNKRVGTRVSYGIWGE